VTRLFRAQGRLPLILQSEVSECGLACLAMICHYHGRQVDIGTMRESVKLSAVGASVRDLMQAATKFGLRGRPLKLEITDLPNISVPAIMHWDMDHYVVLKKVASHKLIIHDPAVGVRTYQRDEIGNHFTGIAIEFDPASDFTPGDDTRRLTLSQLFRGTGRFNHILLQVFLLSFLLQILSLLAPLYLQLVIDQGLEKSDMGLILVLATLFLLLTVTRTLVNHTRGLVLMKFSNQLGYRLANKTFIHLLQLPLSFFSRRNMGDIVSRFASLENIKQLITHEMIGLVVDGLFSIVSLGLLYLYSARLATLVVLMVLLYTVIRLATIRMEKDMRQEALVSHANQQSRFMENIRSITTTRLNGIESQRIRDWQDKYIEFVNAGYRLGRLQLSLGSAQGLIFGLENIGVVFLGAKLVFQGELSLGQLMSFMFLKQHFSGSIIAMLPKLTELRLMKLDLERLADIALQDPEVDIGNVSLSSRPIRGEIEAKNVSFCYSGLSEPLLKGLNFGIEGEEFVVITGPSGSGKSTLVKLLAGLESPQSGSILIDGMPLKEFGRARLRQQVSVVLHDDELLSGDIAFNINLGADVHDIDRLRGVCESVGILKLIERLPLGFSTRVGELGSFLSMGQRKRLLLARALHRRPKILILDETLSNMGDEAALQQLQTLQALGLTLVLVSHNPVLVSQANRQVAL
jgi:ATP-binding cassette, subfamily B, bacterial CvaB/MchF/RaxB